MIAAPLSAKKVQGFLLAMVLAEILCLLAAVIRLCMLPEVFVVSEELRPEEMVSALAGLFYLVVYLCTVVFFARWILRAQKKVRELGASGLPISPVAAVGYFFVPILCLFKPYQAMKDLWRASLDPREWSSQRVPSLLPQWWALWIIGNILGQISFRLNMEAESADSLRFIAMVDIVSALIGVVLALVARTLILRITEQANRWNPDGPGIHCIAGA